MRQFKPAVVQSKNPAGVPNVRRPAAPAVYKPNPTPRVAQAKSAISSKTKTGPTAPPAYRAQPTPKCLQTKSVSHVQPGARVTGPVQPRMAVPKAPASANAGSVRVMQLASQQERKAQQFTGGFRQMGHSGVPMPLGGMATFGQLAIVVEDDDEDALITLGASKNIKGAHAEDVMIGILRDHGGMFDPGKLNPIHMAVTKSPCSSTYGTSKKKEGCTESLIKLITKGVSLGGPTVKFALTLHVDHLYGGSAVRKRASCNALKLLKAAGAEIKLVDNAIVSGEECKL